MVNMSAIIMVEAFSSAMHIITFPVFLGHGKKSILMKRYKKLNYHIALIMANIRYNWEYLLCCFPSVWTLGKFPFPYPETTDHWQCKSNTTALNPSFHINYCFLAHSLIPMTLIWLPYSSQCFALNLVPWLLLLFFW